MSSGTIVEELALAYLSTGSQRQAAQAVGVSETTASRYLKSEEARGLIREARRELLTGVLANIEGKLTAAVDTLGDVMNDARSPAMAKVNAANSLISHAANLAEQLDLSHRLEALEERLRLDTRGQQRAGGEVIQ